MQEIFGLGIRKGNASTQVPVELEDINIRHSSTQRGGQKEDRHRMEKSEEVGWQEPVRKPIIEMPKYKTIYNIYKDEYTTMLVGSSSTHDGILTAAEAEAYEKMKDHLKTGVRVALEGNIASGWQDTSTQSEL